MSVFGSSVGADLAGDLDQAHPHQEWSKAYERGVGYLEYRISL